MTEKKISRFQSSSEHECKMASPKLRACDYFAFFRDCKTKHVTVKRFLFLLVFIFYLFSKQVHATHIVGGELTYEDLGNDQYAVSLIIYRDCLSAQADFDDPAAIGIFDVSGNLVQNLDFDLDSVVTLQSTINSSCVTAPNDVCTEAGYYTEIVTLPPAVGGYTIAYQRCCRNAVVQNIVDPDDIGATYVATIPGSGSSPDNSSPFWNELPPLYVCVNLPFEFDHSAFDADGDSLVYSLCTPYEGATPNAPAPDPPGSPPYTNLTWLVPYSLLNMLGGSVPLTIDPETGEINATPNSVGTFVIGLCVQEYRNGVLLGETRRGVQISVVNCQAPVALPDDINEVIPNSFTNCTGYVEFNAISSSGFDVWWDFGDPTTTADQSTLQDPTWTYPGPGIYDLTLVVFNPINPNDPLCTDTVVQVITIQDSVYALAGLDTVICANTPVQIGGDPIPGWFYSWTPQIGLSDPFSAQPTVNISQSVAYVLNVSDSVGCIATGSDTVFVEVFDVEAIGDTAICIGDTVQLNAIGGANWSWSPNIGISDVNVSNPVVYPLNSITYVVTAVDGFGCMESDSVVVFVQQLPVADAGSDEGLCFGESVQLEASGGGNYVWAPSSSLSNPNISNPTAMPVTTTQYVVIVSDQLGCSDSDTMEIVVNPLPEADAGPDQLVCEGQTTQLEGSGGIDYSWSPTDGLSDPLIADPVAAPELPTEYVLTVTDVNSCTNTDTVFVDVFLVEAIGDTIICIGDEAQIGVIGGVSWSWSPATGLSDPTAQFPIANPITTTVYTVVGDNGQQCTASDSVVVVVSPLPQAFAGFDQGVCAGGTAQLNATGGVVYTWSPVAGLSDPNISDPVVTFSSDTVSYSVIVTDAIGCMNPDTVTVWQEPLPDATAGPDTTICFGESVQLISTGGTTYTWDPPAGLSDPSIENPIATPMATTTYTVTVGQPTGNLVFNGDFSQGNVGFGSDYTYANNLNPEATYGVATDANTLHGAFVGSGHTGNAPLDSFMVVNGAGTPNQNVWCQTISVTPNTDYFFGAWVSTMVTNSPAILQFSINGQVLGTPFSAPFNVNSWIEFSEEWNSANATTATICVVNQNTNTGGNDFALDDISFSTICTNTAEVTVEVNQFLMLMQDRIRKCVLEMWLKWLDQEVFSISGFHLLD